MRNRLKLGGAIVLVIALAIAASVAGAASKSSSSSQPSRPDNCHLGGAGRHVKHVIYLQFDNTHLLRDRTQFASDLELMPHLQELPERQRHAQRQRAHDPDLPHRGRDPELADRPLPGPHGPGRHELVRLLPAERERRLLVLVQVLDGHHRRRQSRDRSADAARGHELQHGQRRLGDGEEHARALGSVDARRV